MLALVDSDPDGGDATVSVVAAKPYGRLVSACGFDPIAERDKALRALLPKYNVDPEVLALEGARVPHRLTLEQLERSAWLIGTEAIAIRSLAMWQLGDQGLGDYLNATCATLGDFLRTTVEFVPLLHDGIRFSLRVDEEEARFEYALEPGIDSHRWLTEGALGKMVVEARRGLGPDAGPIFREVRFEHEPPPYAGEYEALFRAPIKFGQRENALILSPEALTLPFVTADPVLHGFLLHQAKAMLRQRPRRASFIEHVRQVALDELPKSSADQVEVARRLGISAATLRRRLEQAYGARYADLVTELRREVAARHLSEGRLSIDDVGYQAGFAQKTAFYRAFRRWYGCTPAAYRRASLGR